jgi:hypothetical protein
MPEGGMSVDRPDGPRREPLRRHARLERHDRVCRARRGNCARHLGDRSDGHHSASCAREERTSLDVSARRRRAGERLLRERCGGFRANRVAEYAPIDSVNTAATAFSRDWVYLGAHNTPKIVAAPLAGGSFVEVVTGGEAYVWSMTADDDRVYFTSGGGGSTLYSCPANGQPCLPRLDLSPGQGITGKPRAVHFAAGRLFIQTGAGELVSCDPKACSGKVDLLATETAFDDRWRLTGTNIAVDAQAVYYVAREGMQEASFTYVVKRVARD